MNTSLARADCSGKSSTVFKSTWGCVKRGGKAAGWRSRKTGTCPSGAFNDKIRGKSGRVTYRCVSATGKLGKRLKVESNRRRAAVPPAPVIVPNTAAARQRETARRMMRKWAARTRAAANRRAQAQREEELRNLVQQFANRNTRNTRNTPMRNNGPTGVNLGMMNRGTPSPAPSLGAMLRGGYNGGINFDEVTTASRRARSPTPPPPPPRRVTRSMAVQKKQTKKKTKRTKSSSLPVRRSARLR